MCSVSIPDTHADLLERPLLASLATVRLDGAPQVNPVWYVWIPDDGVLKLTHTKHRHAYLYIQREPRVAMSVVDPDNQYRYIQIRGVVEQIEDDPTGDFYQQVVQRYLGHEIEVRDRAVRVVVTVRPIAIKASVGSRGLQGQAAVSGKRRGR